MKEVFLGRLPILDCHQNLVAFELLFRSGNNADVNVIDNSAASANVIIDTYGQLGIENVLGKRRGVNTCCTASVVRIASICYSEYVIDPEAEID